MFILFGALVSMAIPFMALRGRGTRPQYIYGAIAAFPFGAAMLWLGQHATVDKETMSADQMAGTMFINEYFPVTGIVLLVAGLQCVIAAVLHSTPPPTAPEWVRQ